MNKGGDQMASNRVETTKPPDPPDQRDLNNNEEAQADPRAGEPSVIVLGDRTVTLNDSSKSVLSFSHSTISQVVTSPTDSEADERQTAEAQKSPSLGENMLDKGFCANDNGESMIDAGNAEQKENHEHVGVFFRLK